MENTIIVAAILCFLPITHLIYIPTSIIFNLDTLGFYFAGKINS